MTMQLNVEMRRGDTKTFRGFLTDENNQPINDPAAVYKLTARTRRDAADPPIIEVFGTQFVAGEGRCTIAPSDTNAFTRDRILYYDMQVREANSTTTTLLEGRLTVRYDVART